MTKGNGYTRVKVLGLIPARGGSKGLPGKNIKPLGGLPLLARAIRSARESRCLDRIWVSTDDPAIARVSRDYGVPVPWLRPRELARDGSHLSDVLRHLLGRLAQEGYRPDAILVLQPTSPFRSAATIRKAVALFERSGGASVISVTPSRAHPHWCFRIGDDGSLEPFVHVGVPPPRQKLPEAYFLDGSIFMVSAEKFLRTGVFHGPGDRPLIVGPGEGIDIDNPFDWKLAEGLLRGGAAQSRPVYVIAEAGVNHNGRPALAEKLVRAAKAAGADAVKFQTFKAERLASARAPQAPYQRRAAPARGGRQFEMLKALELDAAAHRRLRDLCRKLRIDFLSSPFDEDSADMLDRLGVKLFKLPSGEITNRPLIEHVARKGRPIILSTGMSDAAEVSAAVGWIESLSDAPLTLLHCVSQYPAPIDQVNLRAMDTLREAFGLPVGYSDHTEGTDIAVAAAARGASVIEKHITLDRRLPGPDQRASLEPAEFKGMVAAIRGVGSSLGDGVKKPAPCEASVSRVARRSLVAARPLPAGQTLSAADLAVKRPDGGISPADLQSVIGRTLRRGLTADEPLTWKGLR